MGFFSQLGDIWRPSWDNYGLRRSWDLLGDAWGKTTDSMKSFASGIYGLASAPFDDSLTLRDAFTTFQVNNTQASRGGFGALGDVVGAVTEVPGLRQFFGTVGWAQNELVKRPAGTAMLRVAESGGKGADFFDRAKWRQAYNDTRRVSTGQAAVFAGGVLAGGNPEDPRSAQGQEAYHSNPALKYTSGGVDAAVDIFADPTVIGGKAAVAAKLKWLSPAMRSAADVKKFVDSKKYTKLHNFIKSSDSPEVVRQRVFNAHRGGDKAGALLWSVRHEDDLYDATFNALYGDRDSWDYLVDNAPRIAEVTGRTFANQTIADAANAAGRSVAADAAVDALRETESQAFVDAIANGRGAWGAGRGTLIGQPAPRVTATSKWRAGVHNWVTFGPDVFRGTAIYPAVSRVRYGLPSAKFTRFMDVNDANSVSAFRSNLERAPLTRERVEQFVSQYGRASSPEARARIAGSAEDEGFKTLASKHGYGAADVEKVLPAINKWRSGNRRVFSTSRRFMSNDARKLAQKYIDAGRLTESDNAHFFADDVDAAVKRGDQPSSHYHMLDEDGNNVLIPGRFEVDPSVPAALSQHADIVAMVDWRVLDTALWWTRKGPLGTKAYTATAAAGALLDTANSIWKVTALLRPGYVWRMLSDDVMRRGTLYGSARVLMSTSRGVKNAASNWSGRGGLVRDYIWGQRRAGGLDSVDSVDGDVVDSVDPLTDLRRQPLGGPYEPDPVAVALSAAPGSRLRDVIELTAGKSEFTKADLRRELNMGDQVANRLLSELQSRGVVEVTNVKGRVKYRRVTFDPQDLGLMYQPLDYVTYDRALADGALSVDDFLAKIDEHAERGDLPGEVATALQGKRDGLTSEREFRRQMIDRSLRSVGRGAYSRPEWAQEFVDAVVGRHLDKDVGQVGKATVVDPMGGTSPDADVEIEPHHFTLSKGQSVAPDPEALYDYVADNIDDLLKPRNVLHSYINPDGRLHLSVARWDGSPTQPVKQTGGKRITLGKLQGPLKKMGGHDRVVVNTPQGQVRFAAAFEGAEGRRFMAQASSRGPQDAWIDQMADTEHARLMNATRGQKDISPDDDDNYRVAWERAVNVQLHNDAVARMFLSGKTEDDVLNWMRNTTEGRAYFGRLGPWQSRPVEQIYTIKAMVDTYVPGHGGDASTALRKAALEGNAGFEQFRRLFPVKDEMPTVHGASLDVAVGGAFTNMVKRGVDKAFRALSDIPADTASRFPFFAERYQDHLRDMAPMWAETHGLSGTNVLPADIVGKIQQEARGRALADVKKYLYDTSAALDMAAAGKLFVPFSSAIGDSFTKWGVIAREKGVIPPILNIWKIWTAPDRAGMVQDEDGNVKRWDGTQYVWHVRNPKTGHMELLKDHEPKQEYIVFQLPSGVSPETKSGAKMPAYINKETFNTFLGLPTAGPLVAYPVNEFSLKNPELAEKWFIRKFVQPFGPSADGYKSLVPSNVRSTWSWVTSDEESHRGVAQAVMQTEYTRYSLGLRDKPPTMREVQETAGDMAGLRWTAQTLGVSTQFKSPYQPYVDYYRMLQQTDPENATARFYAEMGDEFKMMTASVSRNVAGLPASVQTAKVQKKYEDLIAKYPDLAPLIVGSEGAGSFSSAVYQAQLEQSLQPGSDEKMRRVLSLQESVEDAERRFVWAKYSKLMDAVEADMSQRGLTSLNQKRAKDLKAARDKFIEGHKYWTNPQGVTDVNPWFVEFSTTDRAAMTKRLTAMAQIVLDDRIGGRNEMRGLYDYLRTRAEVRVEMQRRKFATLDSKKSRRLGAQWDAYVTGLKEQNLAFADLHHRWLVNDDMTADIIVDGGGE